MLLSVFLLTTELPPDDELTVSEDLGDFFFVDEGEPEADGDLFSSFETWGLGGLLLLPRELTASGDLGDFFLVKEEEPEQDGDLYGSFEARGDGGFFLTPELTASEDFGEFFLVEEEEPDVFESFEARELEELLFLM